MVSKVLTQLILDTQWGELDYLVIDFPPGTGDIQITLTQTVPITAAVIVTTPQLISFVDVIKGIEMFDKMKVPTISVVENMSYFICDGCDKQHRIFGRGAKELLMRDYGFKHTFEMPMIQEVASHGDNGTPLAFGNPPEVIAEVLDQLSYSVIRETSKIKFGGYKVPKVGFDEKEGIILMPEDGKEYVINSKKLRISCRCAKCEDELSGKRLLDPAGIEDSIQPLSMTPIGNYALGINWNDGHSSLFPYDVMLALKEEE